MKNLFYFLFAILTLTFAACQKDSDPINPSDISTLIKTETDHGDLDIYTYDNRGRMILETYPDSSKNIFQYYKGYFIEKQYDSKGDLTNLKHFELNADSLVEIITTTAQPEYETRYEYDAQKRLVVSTSTSPGDVYVGHYIYGAEGNQDSVVYSRNGEWLYTYKNTFLEHQPNMYTKKSYGKIYFGEESKNLLAGTYGRFPNPVNNNIFQYDYTFDSQGRITTMIERLNGISEQYDYTY